MGRPRAGKSVRLQPADPFDLIRWLARTQGDPRKAVAELVQNSLDARARHVRVERRRVKGAPALCIRDDGEGVLPDREREDALRYLATNIGHSHKLGLSPSERRERVIAGKYGVGLLGFWSLGHRMEIRSRVRASALTVLRLVEDDPCAEIGGHPLALDAPATSTEIWIFELHEAAQRALGGRRLCDYLAAELRGPLLASGAEVLVHDGLVRGVGQKTFTVVPRRFTGERLPLPAEIAVPGQPSIQVELYLARGVERPAVQLSCSGTLVADDFGELGALGLDRAPWIGRELSGLIEFPAFTVPPGTRRGVVPDAAASAFTEAMRGLGKLVEAEISRLEVERRAAVGRALVAELRRALRGFRNRLPQYELPPVDEGEGAAGPGAPGRQIEIAAARDGADDEEETSDDAATAVAGAALGQQADLFPPGPLAAVRLRPLRVAVAPGGERRVQAVATDGAGRVVREGVTFAWTLDASGLELRGLGQKPAVVAAADARPGQEGILCVTAAQDGRTADARVPVVVESSVRDTDAGLGVPEPELVDAPAATWRSRFDGERWQVNAAHEDYLGLKADGRARLRYLLLLFAKEIVNRTYGGPDSGELLERMVEVLAHAERNLQSGT